MGAFALGECFASEAAAAARICSTYPLAKADGTQVSCSGVDGSALQLVPGGAFSPTFPSCDDGERLAQSSEFFGLACVALAAVYMLRQFVWKLVANW